MSINGSNCFSALRFSALRLILHLPWASAATMETTETRARRATSTSCFLGAMPFEVQGDAPLTAKIAVRLQPEEKAQLREDADIAGISVSELVRRRYFGRPIVANADLMMIRELRRLGGLLKHVHNQSDDVQPLHSAGAACRVQLHRPACRHPARALCQVL